jgi:DNA repair protein RadD
MRELQSSRSVVLCAPTGSGKTNMGCTIALNFKRVLWLANRTDLVVQTRERLAKVGAPLNSWNVSSVQALSANPYKCRGIEADIIVLDECHHSVVASWQRIIQQYPNAKILGLTATPERADGKPLEGMFDKLVVAASYSELLQLGYLVPCRVFRPDVKITGNGLAMTPLRAYQRYAAGLTGFCFVNTLLQADKERTLFENAGIATAIVSARTNKRERESVLDALASSKIKLVINCLTMTEGIDVPSAQVCILARKCGHSGIYIQTTGRILRPFVGKRYGLLLDLVGASTRHGLPTADRIYSLTGTPIKESGAIAVRQCYSCGAVMESWHTSCISCGARFVPGVFKPPKIHNFELLEVYNGSETEDRYKIRELVRLSDTELRWARVAKEFESLFGRKPSQEEWQQASSKSTHREWTVLNKQHGADKASAIIKSYTGVWPSYEWRFEK